MKSSFKNDGTCNYVHKFWNLFNRYRFLCLPPLHIHTAVTNTIIIVQRISIWSNKRKRHLWKENESGLYYKCDIVIIKSMPFSKVILLFVFKVFKFVSCQTFKDCGRQHHNSQAPPLKTWDPCTIPRQLSNINPMSSHPTILSKSENFHEYINILIL